MSILVLAEHDNSQLKAAALNTIGAAQILKEQLGGDIHVLVAGSGGGKVASVDELIDKLKNEVKVL